VASNRMLRQYEPRSAVVAKERTARLAAEAETTRAVSATADS
jgi:hypothetical protein